jgi:apolipoprotein N-acyltransferase
MLVAASLGTAAGIIFPALWWITFAGLALFLNYLRRAGEGLWQGIGAGLFFGVVTGGAGVAWFWYVLPLDFLQIPNRWVQIAAVGMTWVYVSIALGLPIALVSVLARVFRDSSFFPLVCAILWPLAEVGRMWSFALFTWAPQSLFGPHFSPASLGYVLAESGLLLQLADPWGLDALNFTAGLMAGLLATVPDFIRQPCFRRAFVGQSSFLLALLAVAGLSGRHDAPHPPTNLRVALICENLKKVRDFDKHTATADLLAQAAAIKPPVDVVVMPEEISLTSVFWSKQEAEQFLRTHFKTRDVLIMHTRNELYPADEENLFPEVKKLVYEGTTSGEVGRYMKQMLMPLGEYAPVAAKPCFSLLGDADLRLYLDDVSSLPADRSQPRTVEFRGWRLGGLLCSDLLSPYLYRDLAGMGRADVLINLSNPFWFHGSRLLQWKTVQIAKVHAVQNRLPLLVANNLAPSFVVASTGRIVAESHWNWRGILSVDLPLGN